MKNQKLKLKPLEEVTSLSDSFNSSFEELLSFDDLIEKIK